MAGVVGGFVGAGGTFCGDEGGVDGENEGVGLAVGFGVGGERGRVDGEECGSLDVQAGFLLGFAISSFLVVVVVIVFVIIVAGEVLVEVFLSSLNIPLSNSHLFPINPTELQKRLDILTPL
ncbi:hypothetical protein BDV06DRAFT_182281 [Aspergillus oleicola]